MFHDKSPENARGGPDIVTVEKAFRREGIAYRKVPHVKYPSQKKAVEPGAYRKHM
jgi:hypothetical protein